LGVLPQLHVVEVHHLLGDLHVFLDFGFFGDLFEGKQLFDLGVEPEMGVLSLGDPPTGVLELGLFRKLVLLDLRNKLVCDKLIFVLSS
jgi:hypothetical protein